jgi:choline dehydrogenase-like flavoprotein
MRGYLRKKLRTNSQNAGTCRIGTDETALVDTDLRMRGISAPRVADASVMPSAVSANINATVYAIAERAADLIRPWSTEPLRYDAKRSASSRMWVGYHAHSEAARVTRTRVVS